MAAEGNDEQPPDDGPTWSISTLAADYQVTLRTIRHYEEIGLLSPDRAGRTRVFRSRDRVRLALVLRGRRLGFSLDEIARIVNMYDEQPGETGQLHYLLEQIAVRRAELEQRRRDIAETLTELDLVERRCHADLARLGDPPSRPERRPAPRRVGPNAAPHPGESARTPPGPISAAAGHAGREDPRVPSSGPSGEPYVPVRSMWSPWW